MRRLSTALNCSATAIAAAAVSVLLLCAGCGKSPSAANESGKTAAKKTSSAPLQQTAASVAAPRSKAFLSVFSTENPRDPFNPQLKSKAANAAVLTGPQTDVDAPQIIAAVQAGFQGIFGFGEDRELMVHGLLVRENRETTLTVPINGQLRKLKVKALKIYRNTAELQVEGLPQTITVPKIR